MYPNNISKEPKNIVITAENPITSKVNLRVTFLVGQFTYFNSWRDDFK